MRAPFKKGGVAFWHFPKDQIKTFELWWIIAETSASTTRISGIFEASDKKGSSLSFVWSFTESLPAAEQCCWAASSSSSSSCFIKTYSLFSSPPCFTPAAFIKEKKRPRSTSACLWSFYSKQVDPGRWCEDIVKSVLDVNVPEKIYFWPDYGWSSERVYLWPGADV